MKIFVQRIIGALVLPAILILIGESLYAPLAQIFPPEYMNARPDGTYWLNFVPLFTLPFMLLWLVVYIVRPRLPEALRSARWLPVSYFAVLTLLSLLVAVYAYVGADALHVHRWFMIAVQALIAPAVVGYFTYVLPCPKGWSPWRIKRETETDSVDGA